MSIALLRTIGVSTLPLIVEDVDGLLGVRSLLDGGLIEGSSGVIDILPTGRVVLVHPAVVRGITPLGHQFLQRPDLPVDGPSVCP